MSFFFYSINVHVWGTNENVPKRTIPYILSKFTRCFPNYSKKFFMILCKCHFYCIGQFHIVRLGKAIFDFEYFSRSHEVASGSIITPYNKIDNTLTSI